MKIAILMLNLGGPGSLAEVRPFLRNLFADREIIRFPGGALGQRLFAWLLARRKAPESAANYALIGGCSPLVDWTLRQGEGMCALLRREHDLPVTALPCMRYWHPTASAALERALAWGAEHIVAFTQYPHYSTTTTGSSLRDLRRQAAALGATVPISEIRQWHDAPAYVAAWAECVTEAMAQVPPAHRAAARVVYSAHSLPLKFVQEGDPYPDQVRATAALVHAATGLSQDWEVAWQSKVGPIPWLSPSSVERIRALPGEGVRDVVVVPISFVNDHIETLQELDLALRDEARAAGMRSFVRAPSLNTRPAFLRALADVVGRHLRAEVLPRQRPQEVTT